MGILNAFEEEEEVLSAAGPEGAGAGANPPLSEEVGGGDPAAGAVDGGEAGGCADGGGVGGRVLGFGDEAEGEGEAAGVGDGGMCGGEAGEGTEGSEGGCLTAMTTTTSFWPWLHFPGAPLMK